MGLNKKVIGLMKDELGGEIMTEFVTLRPKIYAYKTGGSESKKCKGIKKCVVRRTISFEDYKNCLLSGEASYRSQLMFNAGDINYTSVKFEYDGGKIPPLRIDGKFRLFRFKNSKGDIYSLSIKCNEANESFFERLCEVVSLESCRLVLKVNGRKLKPEEFELVKNSKVERNVYANIYTRKSGKVKCGISLKSPKNTIPIDELVDENFEGSCILRLYTLTWGQLNP